MYSGKPVHIGMSELKPPANSSAPSFFPGHMSLLDHENSKNTASRHLLQVTKRPITPMKSPLKSLLKCQNNGAKGIDGYKTIGNRIFIPMKVTIPAKKLGAKDTNSLVSQKKCTFQMEVSSVQPLASLTNTRPVGKVKVFNDSVWQKNIVVEAKTSANTIEKIKFKQEPNTAPSSESNEYGDLNRFMSSVTNGFGLGSRSDDQDSVVSSTDSNKMSSSISSSKFSDFDDAEDNDLTCLSWLSSNNKELYDTIRKCNPDDPGIGMSGDEMENDENVDSNKLVFTASSRINGQNSSPSHTSNDLKYNPMSKPPYSFSCLIFMAIEDTYLKRLPVKDIYTWVCGHFPYFRTAPPGWKNSIRHNLSLNRCFKKADCKTDSTKGSLWCIDPAYRPNLIQALKRSPFYPFLHPTGIGQPLSLNNLASLLPGVHTGRVPSWSPALPPSTLWADPDMALAAVNLMELRGNDNGSPKRSESISATLDEIFRDAEWIANTDARFRDRCGSNESIGPEKVVIIGSGQDHNYACIIQKKKKAKREENRCTSPESEKSAPDAAYEFETDGLSDSDVMDNIIENIEIDGEDESDSEEQSLFDSGFGSMKDYKLDKSCNKDKEKNVKRNKNAKNNSRKIVCSKKRKATSGGPTAAKKRRYSKHTSSNSPKSKLAKSSLASSRSRTVKVRMSKPSSFASKKLKSQMQKDKSSDVDSGKDSPKSDRMSRSKRLKQRINRKNSNSYHTRSSGHKLLGQDALEKKRTSSNRIRKRLISLHEEPLDDDDEIKRAAGSLLRLAGLIKSPIAPCRAPAK